MESQKWEAEAARWRKNWIPATAKASADETAAKTATGPP